MTLVCIPIPSLFQAQGLEREELTLRGPVHELYEDLTIYSRSNGVSRRRSPFERLYALYSPEGTLRELEEYSDDRRRIYWWRSELDDDGETVVTVVQGGIRMVTTIGADSRIISRRRSSYGTSQAWVYEYDESGILTGGRYSDSSFGDSLRWDITYDRNGMTREIKKSAGNKKPVSIRTYEYTDGILSVEKLSHIDRDGTIASTWEYRFDRSGHRTEEIFRHFGPAFVATWETDWSPAVTGSSNSPESLLMMEREKTGSIQWLRKTYQYDPYGRVIETAEYNSAGVRILKETFVYNGTGDLTEHTTYSSSDSILKRWSYRYEYDARENWTRRETFFTDNVSEEYDIPQEIRTRTLSYHDE